MPPITPVPPIGNLNFPAMLTIYKYMSDASTPLAGVRYALKRNGEIISMDTSGPDGSVNLAVFDPGTYLLQEIDPAPGFAIDPVAYQIDVDAQGVMTIGGQDAQGIGFVNHPTT
ncbi:MAG: prealbumin-like fold domain-containing protein [Eubacteriaceae bacterium]|nr:prealbumin-like fold domain-containing protein [Eubacteriaceae bacterium]